MNQNISLILKLKYEPTHLIVVISSSLGASSGVETLEQFFARLKKKHKWNDQGKVKEVLLILRSNEINTVKVLKDMWEDVKPDLPLSIGMRRCMEEEISNI